MLESGENQPAVYRLAFLTPRLVIELSPAAWAHIQKRLSTSNPDRIRVDQEIMSKLPDFIPPTERSWGFGPAVTTHDRPYRSNAQPDLLPGWISLVCELPKIATPASDGLLESKLEVGWAVSATLDNIFQSLLFEENLGDAAALQGIAINGMFCALRGASLSSPIGAYLSPWLLGRLFAHYRAYGARITRDLAAETRAAYTHMQSYHGLHEMQVREFTAKLDPEFAGVYIGCAGDRAGLNPADYRRPRELSCHNVDSPT